MSAVELGRVERACVHCGREWDLRQAACQCGSHELAERYIEPTIFERGPFGAIKAVVMPAAPKVKPLAPGDVAVLEHAAAAGRAFVAALAEADAVARGAVNNELGSGPTLGFLQSKLSTASSSLGDYSVANLTPVVRPVLAIAELIDDTLAKHAEETL